MNNENKMEKDVENDSEKHNEINPPEEGNVMKIE
jgi:hypothetical protein